MSEPHDPPKKITFHYVKGNDLKSLHVDGAIGGPTIKGKIYLGLFSERNPIPLSVTHELKQTEDPNKSDLGEEIDRTGKQGVVREVLGSFIMDPEVALAISTWLEAQANSIGVKKAE